MSGWQRREFGSGSSLDIGKFVKLDTTDQRNRGCGWVFHVSSEGINGGDTVTQHGAYDTEDDAKRAAENWIREFCATAFAAIREPVQMPPPDAIVRDASGNEIVAMFYYAAAEQNLGDIADEQGFDCLAILAQDEIGENDPLYARLESLELLASEWTPAPHEGWQLALKFDGEEGPTALFIRRKSSDDAIVEMTSREAALGPEPKR